MRSTALRSVLWVAFQKWGNQFAALVVFALLGRLLRPSDIGLAALAAVFVSFFQVLADQGFATALIQKRVVDRDDCDTAFWMSVASALGLVVVVVALAPVAAWGFDQPRLTGVLWVMSPVLVLTALAGTPSALLERDFQFKSLTLRTLFGSVIGGAVGVACAATGGGVWSIVAQTLVTNAVSVIFLWRVTSWRPRVSISRKSLHDLRVTGISVLGIQVVALVNAQSDKLILGAYLGPTALGYYYIGSRIITILIDIQTSVIEAVSLTTLSKLQDDKRRLREAFYTLTGLGAASAIGTFAIVAVTAPVTIPLLFGPHWEPAVTIMQVLCLMGCLNSIIVFDRNALIAVGAAKAALTITFVQCVVGLVAVGVAVHWGVVAVAVAVVLRQYLVWPLRLSLLRREFGIRIRIYLLHWAGPMLSGSVVFAVSLSVAYLWRPGSGLLPRVSYTATEAVLGVLVYTATMRYTSPMAYVEFARILRSLLSRSSVAVSFIARLRLARLADIDD